MLRRLTVPLVLLVLLLAAPAVAAADDPGPLATDGPDVQVATKIAEDHWGAVPCSGQVSIDWQASPDTLLNALSTWLNPLTAWLNPNQNSDCKIALNPNAQWDWPKLCTVMSHEIGHLLGHPHSTDPDDLMAPIYNQPLPACVSTPEPEGKLGAAMPVPAAPDPAQVAAASPVASASPAPAPAPVPAAVPVAAPAADPLVPAPTSHDVSLTVETAAPLASPASTKAAKAAALRTCLRKAVRKQGRGRVAARAACKRRATASVRAVIR